MRVWPSPISIDAQCHAFVVTYLYAADCKDYLIVCSLWSSRSHAAFHSALCHQLAALLPPRCAKGIMSIQSEALDALLLTVVFLVVLFLSVCCALLCNDMNSDIFVRSNCLCPCYECCDCCDDLEDCSSGQTQQDLQSEPDTEYRLRNA